MRFVKRLLPVVITGALIVGAALSLGASSPEIELTVTARGMSFYIGDHARPNPPHVLESDRRVRITFVNEDRGVDHDLLMADLSVRTDLLPGDGSRQTIRFRTPARSLESSYTCSRHMAMMTGDLTIR